MGVYHYDPLYEWPLVRAYFSFAAFAIAKGLITCLLHPHGTVSSHLSQTMKRIVVIQTNVM